MKKLIAATLIALHLAGCAVVQDVLNDNTLLAGVAAYKATQAMLEQSGDPQARAKRILDYTDEVVGFLGDEEDVTINLLHDFVHGLVMAQVPEVDRQPAEDMLLALRERLAEEIGEFEVLTPETQVSVLHVIERIRMAAELYA
jgi:hypothetical protein